MKDLKNVPLGIPMVFASLGTIGALAVSKQLHAELGILWVGLSIWHGMQHCKKMKKDANGLIGQKLHCPRFCESESPMRRLLSTICVVSYIEGRIRIRSAWFVNNPELQKQVEGYVLSFTGVKKAKINHLTGSLLIEYDAEKLRTMPRLAALEAKARAMAGIS